MDYNYLIYSLEDDENISHVIKLALSKNGYRVNTYHNYNDFINDFNKNKPNMILLDLMLPDISGEEILKEIRQNQSNDDIEIIIISAKNLIINKVDGLDLGADDYISKPFDILELISRVNARSRRYLKKKEEIFEIRTIKCFFGSRQIFNGNNIIKFTNSEYLIFEHLIKNRDKIISREELFSLIWGRQESFETRILDVHIKEIRRKLGKENCDLIETIYGVGYRFKNE